MHMMDIVMLFMLMMMAINVQCSYVNHEQIKFSQCFTVKLKSTIKLKDIFEICKK